MLGYHPKCYTHHYHDGVCCNCSAVGGPLPLQQAQPKTQKARGVKALHALGFKVPAARLVACDQDMQALLTEARSKPLFARPCPPTPRPGFVDSRLCTDDTDYQAVWAEARKADPAAELLLMPMIPSAVCNYVLCPGLMTVGPGHDGATAGKQAVGFPITGEDPVLAKHHGDLGIADGEVPHVELVVQSGYEDAPWWTQCRSGPPHPGGGPDYVPVETTVTGIVVPCDDFLEWEARVKAGFAPGTVVWGKGHTLGSHAALHCLAHQVPFVTSHEPVLGDVLPATPTMPAYDLDILLSGLAFGLTRDLMASHDGHDISTILYGLHNAPALRGQDSWWLGYAAALMLRFGMRASDVELHITHAADSLWGKGYGTGLHSGVKAWLGLPPNSAADYLSQERVCTNLFYTDLTVGGIGGIKWAWCSQTMRPLAEAIHRLCQAGLHGGEHDTENLVQLLIQALNSAINQAHNGGYWMNKFGGSEATFMEACKGKWAVWVGVAPRLMQVRDERAHITPTRAKQMEACLHDWAVVVIPGPYTPVIDHVTLTGHDHTYGGADTLSIYWVGRSEPKIINVTQNKVSVMEAPRPVTWATHHTDQAWAWTFECKGQSLTCTPHAMFQQPQGGIRLARTRQ